MFTVRQIERLWNVDEYQRIISICMQMRIEASSRLQVQLSGSAVAAAALAVIRLEELNQPYLPICSRFIRVIIAAQQPDGGWGDPLITALCLRALMCSSGAGLSIERGIQCLAALQKTDGTWPRVGFRRMPGDAYVTAFVLFCLMDDGRFTRAVRIHEAVYWFEANEHLLDADAVKLWQIVSRRRQARPARPFADVLS